MAEFSKQWTELHDPEMPYDFDIEEVANNNLKNGEYTPMICEGFGFHAIGKNDSGNTILAFENQEAGLVKWVDYEEYMREEVNRILASEQYL